MKATVKEAVELKNNRQTADSFSALVREIHGCVGVNELLAYFMFHLKQIRQRKWLWVVGLYPNTIPGVMQQLFDDAHGGFISTVS